MKFVWPVLLFMLLFSCKSGKKTSETVHFLVAGHSCGSQDDSAPGQYEPFRMFLKKQREIPYDFLMLTGDVVYENNPIHWKAFEHTMGQWKAPYYIAPGNQELKGDYKHYDEQTSEQISWMKGNHLFVIWSVYANGWNVSSRQLESLTKQVRQKHPKHVFIFTHEVIWYDSVRTPRIIPNSIEGKAENTNFYTRVLPALTRLNRPVYLFAGDVGARPVGSELTIHAYKQVKMIASGMGGGIWDNLMEVTIHNDSVFLDINYLMGKPKFRLTSGFNPIVP